MKTKNVYPCWYLCKMLPKVYKPKERPWLTIENATTEELKEKIKACPSGALSYRMNAESNKGKAMTSVKVEALENRPHISLWNIKCHQF